MLRIPWKKVDWRNSLFLIGTFLTTVIAVPAYIWQCGLDAFQVALFLMFFVATGLSITLGYHRLFSHLTFSANGIVRFFTLLFGAAAFENSALMWCADHRRHHKFVDHDEDPYDISKGFWHAHVGWLLFRLGPETPLTWVRDLQKDKMVVWQHKHYVSIAVAIGFGLPTLIGYLWGGWNAALGSFLIAGVARVVFVHHMTFCINSLCHSVGKQPYSSKCTARDSMLMAFFTFGEGYHNFHHEFQHDYRNGVKPWQFDPTKWTIWTLHKLGLAKNLRTVPEEKILKAELAEQQRRLAEKLSATNVRLSDSVHDILHNVQENLHASMVRWEQLLNQYREAAENGSRRYRRELKRQVQEAGRQLQAALDEWRSTHQFVYSSLPSA